MSQAFTQHGGRLTEARAHFGGSPTDWLDLSTGINPAPFPWTEASIADWRALPDPQALLALEQRAAAFFGADPRLCCAVPGSEVGLRLVARILGLPGRHLPLSYSTHADAFSGMPQPAPDAPCAFVIANPNNPDGKVTPRPRLHHMLERQEADRGWLIVDEAFADCSQDWSIASEVNEGRGLIVLRSFGKFFGLAGVRLGFVIAPNSVLDSLRHLLGEWPVCAAALTVGSAAYADRAWVTKTRDDLPLRAERLDAMLRQHGLAPTGECPLYRLVETDRAAHVFSALARRHILTRPFAAHPRLLRFGVPMEDAMLDRLGRALTDCANHG